MGIVFLGPSHFSHRGPGVGAYHDERPAYPDDHFGQPLDHSDFPSGPSHYPLGPTGGGGGGHDFPPSGPSDGFPSGGGGDFPPSGPSAGGGAVEMTGPGTDSFFSRSAANL